MAGSIFQRRKGRIMPQRQRVRSRSNPQATSFPAEAYQASSSGATLAFARIEAVTAALSMAELA
jgi:hypothetical protein